MRTNFLLLLLLSFMFSCKPKENVSDENQVDTIAISKSQADAISIAATHINYNLVYTGILPCNDCDGIKTTYNFSTHDNLFILTQEYLGTQKPVDTLKGSANTERGFENDRNATVYVLNDDKPEEQQIYFVRKTGVDGILTKLDEHRHLIPNAILKEVIK